jgi:hypothetical protein
VEKCDEEVNDNIDELTVRIYPNPADGFINIDTKTINEDVQIIINDVKGSILHNVFLTTSRAKILNEKIDVSNYETGTYFLRLISSDNQIVKKLIVI